MTCRVGFIRLKDTARSYVSFLRSHHNYSEDQIRKMIEQHDWQKYFPEMYPKENRNI